MNSPVFQMTFHFHCIHFWFYASAPNIGSLTIIRVKASDDTKRTNLWFFNTGDSTDGSDLWQEGQVQYVGNHDNGAISLTIQAAMGTGTEGLAIDDIIIEQKSCESMFSFKLLIISSIFSVLPATAATTHSPTPTTTTTILAPPSPTYGCDFEQGTFCKWTVEQGGSLTDWLVSSRDSDSNSLLPHEDHTFHNGMDVFYF